MLPKQPAVMFLDPGLGMRGPEPGIQRRQDEEYPSPWRMMESYYDLGYSFASQVG